MMNERGLSVDHTTIYRLVQAYAPELEKRIRPHLRLTNDSYRVDETYIKVKGAWKYLYRAVDSTGQTIDFMLSARRDKRAAKRFLRIPTDRERRFRAVKGKFRRSSLALDSDHRERFSPPVGIPPIPDSEP